jgi:hypothetical protein
MWVPLHNPVIAVFASIDPTATRAFNPPGEDASGYDDVFQQPSYYVDASGARHSATQTVERRALAQVEVDRERLKRMIPAGDMPIFDMGLVLHVHDLARRGLINADGTCVIKVGDRLRQLLHPRRPTTVLDTFTGNEACWIVEVRSASWGFTGRRDLFVLFIGKQTEPG